MTIKTNLPECILIADDDNDDQYILKQAFATINKYQNVQSVNNAVELMDYLLKKGKFLNTELATPKLILLDLNMPIKDGRESLKEIKTNTVLKKIPIVIYSTSSNPKDVEYAYQMGANSYITKPYSYQELVKLLNIVNSYWFNIVTYPN